MKIRTKILGAFSVMLALVLTYQAGSYFLTKKSVDSLAGVRNELEERRLTLEARHLFVMKMLSFGNHCLYQEGDYAVQFEYADKAFRKKLDSLGAQLRKCGDPHQFEVLKVIRDDAGSYNREIARFAKDMRAAGPDSAALRLKPVENMEAAVLLAFEDIQKETTGMIADEEKKLPLYDRVRLIFPSFKPIIEARQRIAGGGDLLWAELELDDTEHQMATAWRRFLLTGQERYVSLYDDLERLFDLRAGRRGDELADAKGFKDAVSASFKDAVRMYRSGDREGARTLMLKSFVSEQMLDAALDDRYAKDLADFQSAYASLPPIMDYALSFNRQLLIFTTVVTAFILMLGSAIVGRITRPIKLLELAVEKVADGDLSHKVEVTSRDEVGRLALAFNRMTDDLEKAGRGLRESHERYQAIVENVGEGIALIGPDMETLSVNRALRGWFDDIGRVGGPYCFSNYDVNTIKAVEYCLPYETLYEHRHADGPVYYKTSNYPIKGGEGHTDGAVIIFEDVTEKLKYAQERATLITELERSNRELQDFAYIASHDLQSPLRKVVSFSQLLEGSLKGRLREDDIENLHFLVSGALHMQRLINDLLSYSRVTTKGKPPEHVDTGHVLREVLEISLSSRIQETGGKVTVEGALPCVMADSTQVYQLLQNIIDNALKYRRDGVAPEIGIRVAPARDGFVRVEVSDNGIGIDPQYHEKVFKMFQRLHAADKYEGTGIGLAVCQRIARRHGGDIGVRSRPGGGSVFWFTLPMAEDEASEGRIKEAA